MWHPIIDVFKKEEVNMMNYTREQLEKYLETLFKHFELGDAIQILDEYIYVEIWIKDREYKVRYPFIYTENEPTKIDELTIGLLWYILRRVDGNIVETL